MGIYLLGRCLYPEEVYQYLILSFPEPNCVQAKKSWIDFFVKFEKFPKTREFEFFANLKKLKNMNVICWTLKKSKTHRFNFYKVNKIEKCGVIFFSSIEKLQKTRIKFYLQSKKAQKTWAPFFRSLKMLKKHGLNFSSFEKLKTRGLNFSQA